MQIVNTDQEYGVWSMCLRGCTRLGGDRTGQDVRGNRVREARAGKMQQVELVEVWLCVVQFWPESLPWKRHQGKVVIIVMNAPL